MKNKFFIVILLGLALAACGKKGPLTLEPEDLPPAVENFQVKQVGEQIEFSWTFPSQAADRREPFKPAAVTRVHVQHAVLKAGDDASTENFAKKAGLLARVRPGEVMGFGSGNPTFHVQFKGRELQGRTHAFSLGYDYGRQRSAQSPVMTLNTLGTPPPIQDLQAGRDGKMVVLKWSGPGAADKDKAQRPILGYQVYRRINAVNGEPGFRPIGSGRTVNELFRDLDTGTDGEYEYQVSCVLDERVESAPSNTASVKVLDTFPPDVPNNLVSFTSKDQIFLTWENVPDPDLACYRLYRKTTESGDFTLLADEIKENFYRDKNISNGKLYVYAVSAVDRKGNESEPSPAVQQLFE